MLQNFLIKLIKSTAFSVGLLTLNSKVKLPAVASAVTAPGISIWVFFKLNLLVDYLSEFLCSKVDFLKKNTWIGVTKLKY